MTSSPYRMSLSRNELNHLALNLYSNVPAVLSQVIANSWDADATKVDITMKRKNGTTLTIVIHDNGVGMTRDEINERFLLVGYRRRRDQPGNTAKGRPPMGRKGIGMLSLFSVADEIVVETARDGQKSALRMCLSEIEDVIGRELSENGVGQYSPIALDPGSVEFDHGSRITLSGIRKRQTTNTANDLKKRLARQFSIIGDEYEFSVSVNDSQIHPRDRDYYDKIQYVWTYGSQLDKGLFQSLDHPKHRRSASVGGTGLSISGWIGTVRQCKQLREYGGENLNRIAIFMRGKMAQEDMLRDLTESGIFSSHLIGELRVDGLDTGDGTTSMLDDDMATSSRQNLVEDDSRYVALREFLRKELKVIECCWLNLRDHDGVSKATSIPQLEGCMKKLQEGLSKIVESCFGKINRTNIEDESERHNLLKYTAIAFDSYLLNQRINELKSLPDNNVESAIAAFRKLDELEVNMYGQIVRSRIGVIRSLLNKFDKSEIERVIQGYILDHLWLLDPSWDRVDGTDLMGRQVGILFDEIEQSLSAEERRARIGIRYRRSAGKHIIIELKRPDVQFSVFDLCKQIGEYREGVRKILNRHGLGHEAFEFVCILGQGPVELSHYDGDRLVKNMLHISEARYVCYEQLLDNAFNAYEDYGKCAMYFDQLSNVMEVIENHSEPIH